MDEEQMQLISAGLDAHKITGGPQVLQYFRFAHLPAGPLRERSALFAGVAMALAAGPSNEELLVALRKLLEAKDAAVRALLP